MLTNFPGLETETVVIANGASLSSEADLKGRKLVGILMPASWTAATITFQSRPTAAHTATNVYDAGTERSIAVDASRFHMVDIEDWMGVRFLAIRSGTAGAAVNQGAERTLTLVLQP